LSLVNPAAFSRAVRVRRYMHHLVERLGLGDPWRFEVAAMMSQLGCVTLHPHTIEAVYAGEGLSPAEQARFDSHPKIAAGLLASIPRMEPIAWMIAHQMEDAPADPSFADRDTASAVQFGATILRASLLFDELLTAGSSGSKAATEIARRLPGLDPRICQSLEELEPDQGGGEQQNCPVAQLAPGMILRQEVRAKGGKLIATKGQDITLPLILKLKIAHEKGTIPGDIVVSTQPVA